MRCGLYNLPAFQAARFAARLLPLSAARKLAHAIGQAAFDRNPKLRAVLRENLRPVTDLDGHALDRLCRRNVTNFCAMLADYFYSASRGPLAAVDLIGEWRGYEHLEEARRRGKGVIIATAHLGHWELGGILLAHRGLPMTVVTAEEPSTALTEWRDAYRRTAGVKTIAVGPGREFSFVEMIQTLRRNECLAMLVDRPYGETACTVRVCGSETRFSTAPALLWQHTGAAVVPAFLAHGESGRYISFAEPIVEMSKTGDPRADLVANTQSLASAFEPVIRRYPDQWFHYVPVWTSPHDSHLPASV
jgi:KDO2-lipid IV(A) lauroyltransferase